MPSDLDASSSDASIDAEIVLENDAATAPTPSTTPAPPVTTSPHGTNLAGGGPPDCHLGSGGLPASSSPFSPVGFVLVLVLAVLKLRRSVDRRPST